jgi:hypothetical protein
MVELCEKCGANIALVGIRHRCVPKVSSEGLRVKSLPKPKGEPVGDGVALTSIQHPPGLIEKMADALSSGKLSLKRGRPLAKDADKSLARLRPWEKEGMSRRTWFRRRGK